MNSAEKNASIPTTGSDLAVPDVLQKQFLFIIGSDRSGTTWLQSMVGAHPQVATSVQLTLFHTYIPDWLRSWKSETEFIADSRQWDMGLPVVWSEAEFLDFLREFLARVYARVLAGKPTATHVLDKHPAYREHVEEIHLLLPQAKFIHVIRDGRDVALSLLAAKEGLGWGYSTLNEATRAWAHSVKRGRDAAVYGDQYLEVRYEELLEQGPEVLAAVFDFCDLPCDAPQVQQIVDNHQFDAMKKRSAAPVASRQAPPAHYRSGKAGAWRQGMTPAQQREFNMLAGDLLRELNYADADWLRTGPLRRGFYQAGEVLAAVRRRMYRAFNALAGRA
ncbi:sulfotransferase family protein [Lignipirellula cremea]|uniref:Sulfotransferase domain protein n=1 Tax=Lignipirellula cremea TaxID=2528010 RepID=A0A518DL32_9BACT|nr:sulfotransferase [Lignipirellula cremea]QDU92541.1 Sulfotransferase domain protein [Lignipirellula cremea]